MAKTVYVDGASGDNSNDGLSWVNAKKTILGARAATASGDLVLIAPGIYTEADAAFTSANDANVLYRRDPTKAGKVIVDFENRPATQSAINGAANWRFDQPTWWLDVHFRNPYSNDAHSLISGINDPVFFHCVFYQRDGTAQTGRALSTRDNLGQGINAINCSFYNLGIGGYGMYVTPWVNNYFVSVTTVLTWQNGTSDYNAYPGNTEVNGINTSVTDVGFTDAANEDFSLDTTDPDWGTFRSSGQYGGAIAAWANGGLFYQYNYPQLEFFAADQAPTVAQGNPQPSWENEGPNGTNTYTAGTPTDVVKNGATGELELDLGTVPTATGGRVRSDVFDLGATTTIIRGCSFAGFEDIANGAAFDINNTLPQHAEYRSSATSFLKGDVSPSWTTYQRGDNLNVSGHRYIQLRLEFRTDHTNT